MVIDEKEVIASLRVLVCVAKSDGILHDEERSIMEASLAGIQLPQGTTIHTLLDEQTSLDEQLRQITSEEGREQAYQSAYGLAHADGLCSPEEQKLLDHIRQGLNIPAEKATLLRRVFSEAKDTILPSTIKAVADPAKRQTEIKEDVMKYSILSSVLGAFPVPGLAILAAAAVVGLQVKMIRDIGQYWGHVVDKQAARSLLYGVGLGTGARIAVTNLCKLVPGWGSAVGAASSFAATWALGRIANQYFEAGGKVEISTLRDAFRSAEREGKMAFDRNKNAIEAKQNEHKAKLETLAKDVKDGKLSREEYENKVAELA